MQPEPFPLAEHGALPPAPARAHRRRHSLPGYRPLPTSTAAVGAAAVFKWRLKRPTSHAHTLFTDTESGVGKVAGGLLMDDDCMDGWMDRRRDRTREEVVRNILFLCSRALLPRRRAEVVWNHHRFLLEVATRLVPLGTNHSMFRHLSCLYCPANFFAD